MVSATRKLAVGPYEVEAIEVEGRPVRVFVFRNLRSKDMFEAVKALGKAFPEDKSSPIFLLQDDQAFEIYEEVPG